MNQMNKHEPSLAQRRDTAAEAKRSLLERACTASTTDDAAAAERKAKQRALRAERDVRIAQRKAALRADKLRKAEVLALKEAQRQSVLEADQERRKAELEAQQQQAAALLVEQKRARDARYARRKARNR